jgi:hypothetical protein
VSLPTLEDLKAETNIPSTADDDELQIKLDQAIAMVEGMVGPIDTPVEVTETHYSLSSDVLVLRKMPVASLVSISSRYGAVSTPLVLADYELDPEIGVVRAVSGYFFRGTYTVTYTAGYDQIPADLAGGIVIIAAHLWQTQLGTTATALLQDPNATDFSIPGMGVAIPNRAKELLAPHMRPSVA